MRGQGAFNSSFVDFIPEKLDEGVLYISRRYRTASHLCACGCGLEVVTPLNPAKWSLTENADGTVSMNPSIGNWGFPCRSHYFINRGRVQWAAAMSDAVISAVQARDKGDANLYARRTRTARHIIADTVLEIWQSARDVITGWWR